MSDPRRWFREHGWGFDCDIDDFSLTYGPSDDTEVLFLQMAVNGFSCGYPECCVFDFMRKWWEFAKTHDLKAIRSKRLGVTENGQRYAQCEGHQ